MATGSQGYDLRFISIQNSVRLQALSIRINGVAFFEEENSWLRFCSGQNKTAVRRASTVQLRDDPVTGKTNMFETKIARGYLKITGKITAITYCDP